MLQNIQIIITNSTNKKELLKELSSKLVNVKIYTLNEFNKLFYFDYDVKTLNYVINKYQVKYEIAKIYLDNLLYVEDKEYKSTKLNFLSQLKNELLRNNLLIINKLFKNTLKNKNIVIYNLPVTKELEKLITMLKVENNVEIVSGNSNSYEHEIRELATSELEVEYVANEICNLIKKGIDITHIFISNLDNEYRKLIKRIFPMFNIPYTIKEEEVVYGTFLCSKFLELNEGNIEEALDKLKDYVTSSETEKVYNILVNIVNKYVVLDDDKIKDEMIKYDLKHTYLESDEVVNSVHEVDINTYLFNDDDYVFCLSFNQGIMPRIYKDENYLTDKEKQELGLSLTIERNVLEKEIVKNKLAAIKNLFISYKVNKEGEVFYISSLNEELKYNVITDYKMEYNNSNLNNQLKLASLLDEYYKYGSTSDLLIDLNGTYDIPYNTYNNKFKGIDNEAFKKFINNKITLSYSSLDKYFRCPFSYYVGNILKLNIYEETFFQLVGTLFHSILEKFLKSNLSYDDLWEQEIKALNHEFTSKENFFLIKLKEELSFIIEVIKNQENFTNLHDELHEERIITNIEGNIEIKFTGIIDKIKYKNDGNETIIAIIDYKTGNPNLDLSTIPYGIGMQLSVYLYLAKHSKKLENIKVAGFYLQKVLNNEVNVDKNKSYEQLKKQNLLLQGYSNENQALLSEFDNSYTDSNIIRSMKTLKDGSFAKYTKVLSNEQMDKLIEITEEKINEGAKKIEEGNFDIAPKKIEKENYGCKYCEFRDICFHTEADVVELEPLKTEEILGGEDNELD